MNSPSAERAGIAKRGRIAAVAAGLAVLCAAGSAVAVRAPVLPANEAVEAPVPPRVAEQPDQVLAAVEELAPIRLLNPSTVRAGGPAFEITLQADRQILGAIGQQTARIGFGQTQIQATFSEPAGANFSEFKATVPPGQITAPGPREVSGYFCLRACEQVTETVTLTVQAAPPPTIGQITPSQLPAASGESEISINGTGFGPESQLQVNGGPRSTDFQTTSLLKATLTAADLNNPGPLQLRVRNPGNPDTFSAAVTFTVSALPTPVITSVAPPVATAGSGAQTITLRGTGFRGGSKVIFGGAEAQATTFTNPTTVTAVIAAPAFAAPGPKTVIVRNPPNRGGDSAAATFTVFAVPAISAIAPQGATAGSGATTLSVQGSGFTGASRIFFAGTALDTNLSNGTLTATIPAAALAEAGNSAVLVSNPPNRGGNSASATFTAFGAPTIASLSPATVGVGSGAVILTVDGEGFDPQADLQINGQDVATTRVSTTKLTTTLSAELLSTPGTLKVRVQNPPNLGGTGTPEDFTIEVAPTPVISAVSPGAVAVGSPALTLAVLGNDFHPASVVTVNGQPRGTTYRSTNRLDVALPATDLAAAGPLSIKVLSPGSESTATTFTVLPPGQTPPAEPGNGPIPEPVVAAVPTVPPTVGEISDGPAIPGEVISIAGQNFGAEQGAAVVTIGGEVASGAAEWSDGRIDIRVPDLPPGTSTITITTAAGVISVPVTVAAEPAAPPIGNPVLLPGKGATVIFDASTAIDPVTGAGAPGDAQANVAGLSGIASVLWNFGDGSTSPKTTVSKTYTAPGTYKPSVTITTDAGARSTTPAGTVRVVRGSSGGLVAKLPPVNFAVPSKVVFDAGQATLRPESRSYMLKLASLVKRVGRRTEIGGHTDSVGSFSRNQDLSTQRARSVRAFLINEGKVPKGLLSAAGYGETRPIDDNGTALGRQRNRRVELSIPRGGTPIRLTSRQLLINQRISQVAVARVAALEARLTGGLGSEDILNGSIAPQDFGPSVAVTGSPSLRPPAVAPKAKLKIARPKRSGSKLKVSERQLLINQRIAQAAVRRVNRLDSVMDVGLTGAAVSDGAVTGEDLAPGVAATPAAPVSSSEVKFTLPPIKAPKVRSSDVRATQEQLIINQRVSQAAIRRLNLMIARLEKGLTSADFQDGSLTAADIAR